MDPSGTAEHDAPKAAPPARILGAIALIGVGIFATVCAAVQFLRRDYAWLRVPLSFYALGPYGRAVVASYFALSAGLVSLGLGWYRTLAREARSAAPLLLFVIGAFALGSTAIDFTDVPNRPPTFHGFMHVLAAGAAFLCVTVAMLLQAWRLRLDRRWRARFRSAFTLAAITFVALWIYALVKPIPRGLGEKILIVLILLWLWRAAWWLATDRSRDRMPTGSS